LGPNKKKLKSMTKLNWHKRIKWKIKNKKNVWRLRFTCQCVKSLRFGQHVWSPLWTDGGRFLCCQNLLFEFFLSKWCVSATNSQHSSNDLPPLHFPPCLEIRVAATTTKTLVIHSVLCVCARARVLSVLSIVVIHSLY
jgi:hypothetical protein